ncbi:Stk1 family PASTA domain-containing Ser/Thr kinase [Lactobacillus sp. DCY120]|uniref:non-specific serine/threonine protein kinase n=1 Tax=Bombilactobacillus apium TaxID=2675299 RepID=A0A850RCD6_9LACO|nr:Stk1 family PASTA domain-containing Ser/Thr kinase [Bombilactobacillus apium]NVY96966.1 Stk1 family PASTA domain-containing Ser/Thr kinase [Bombilactobacillus apium]
MINKGDLIAQRYLIRDTLGEGGMSNVYLAEDTFLHRLVALKSLRFGLQDNQHIKLRFKRESVAMSKLSSPYIVNIFDVSAADDFPYIVMEYIPGPTLKQYLHRNYPLPYAQVVQFMLEILQGVAVAHEHGIIHRDLKPQNVLLTPDGHVKVTDFGIAISLGEQSITQTDSTLGSIQYMAPERVRGVRATVQSDIYALGIILYEMLANHLPFEGTTSVSIALQHFNESIPTLGKLTPELPQALENVVLKATAKDPAERYASVLEMITDLKTVLDPNRAQESRFVPLSALTKAEQALEATKILPSLAVADGPTGKTTGPQAEVKAIHRPWWRKKRWWTLIFGLLLACVLGGGSYYWFYAREVAVPDLSNLSVHQAQEMLTSVGLKSGSLSHQVSGSVEKGKVVRSLPATGVRLKHHAPVRLVLSQGPQMRTVPDVVGLAYTTAKSKLQQQHLRVKRQNRYSSKVPMGLVIKQGTKAHRQVVNRKQIVVTVSLGPKLHLVKVKSILGYNLKAAQSYASGAGLNLVVNKVESKEDPDTVISQIPDPGTQLAPGDDLTINLSVGINSEADNATTAKTITKEISIPYDKNQGNTPVQIYLQDNNHNIRDLYQSLNIKDTTKVKLPFTLNRNAQGSFRVIQNNKVLLSDTVTNN